MKPTYEELEAEVIHLRSLLKAALERIAQLEERLNLNSKNSSKPPSSDQKGNSSNEGNLPRKSHKGIARALYPPERIDQHIPCTSTFCPHCNSKNLNQLSGESFVWQQAELPKVRAVVTQFNCLKYRCEDCGKRSTASLPKGIAPSAFGPRLMALITSLTGQFHLAKREAIQLVQDLYGVDIAEGSIINIEENMAMALAKVYERIHRFVTRSGITRYFDETSWRNSGKSHYIWLGTTVKAAYYKLDRHRSQEAFLRIIGNHTAIPTVTDRYGVYHALTGPHQYCLAHLIRDFRKFGERQGEDRKIGKKVEEILREVCKTHRAWKLQEISERQYRMRLAKKKKKLEDKLLDGLGGGSEELAGLCERLLDSFIHLWTFSAVEGMDPTNNMAERDLRKLVLWRKKSYGTRSDRGQRFVERISSVVESLKKNGGNVLGFLTEALKKFHLKEEAPFIDLAYGF
jgi:transposase